MHTRKHAGAVAVSLLTILSGCATMVPAGPKLAANVALGRDFQTDAWIFGLGGDCTNVYQGIGLEGALAFGTGKETLVYEGPFKVAQEELETEYNVLRASARFRYRVAVSDDGRIVAYPLVAPGYYRWKQKDCDFEDCTENLFVADIGGGIMYRFVGAEIFTTANGPDFGVRLVASIPVLR